MKSWFAKFRISATLDSGKALPPSLRDKIIKSDELREFAQQTTALDRALKGARPAHDAPPWLHGWIMRSVRAGAQPAQRQYVPAKLAWLGGAALAAIALGWVCWSIFSPVRPHSGESTAATTSLEAASTALALGNDMTRDLPTTLVAPLSDE